MKVVTRIYPLSCFYITFAHDISRDQKHMFKMAKNTSKRPHVQGVLDNLFPTGLKIAAGHRKMSGQDDYLSGHTVCVWRSFWPVTYAVSEQLTRKKLFALFLDIYKQLNHKISQQLVVIKKEADFHFFSNTEKKSPFSKISGYMWTGPY